MPVWWFVFKEAVGFQLSLHFPWRVGAFAVLFLGMLIASAERLFCLAPNDACLVLYFKYTQLQMVTFHSNTSWWIATLNNVSCCLIQHLLVPILWPYLFAYSNTYSFTNICQLFQIKVLFASWKVAYLHYELSKGFIIFVVD